nr:ribonuclease H-like domain-containing protein [Tanacetum cinerariifolium]
MKGKKLKDLKNKPFDSIQKMSDRVFKRLYTFVDFKTRVGERSIKKERTRADGSSKMYLVFSQLLKSFDIEDLVELYKLLKARYGSSRLVEDLNLLLWGDLKIMFEPYVEDEGRIVGIKSLLEAVRITATYVFVNTAQWELLLLVQRLLKVNTAEEVTTAQENIVSGKFDGKANEGFFVGYSLNSKAFRVFNSRTRIVEENLDIRFSESTPNVVGTGPDWLFDIDTRTRTINYEPIIACTQSNGFAEDVNIFDFSRDDEDDSVVADMNNLDTTIQ